MSPTNQTNRAIESVAAATATTEKPLRQPWKAHWPPTAAQLNQPLTGLGFKKDQFIVMDGTSVFPSNATQEDDVVGILAEAREDGK